MFCMLYLRGASLLTVSTSHIASRKQRGGLSGTPVPQNIKSRNDLRLFCSEVPSRIELLYTVLQTVA